MSLHITDHADPAAAMAARRPMASARRRGRPKSVKTPIDLGTPELNLKRAFYHTTESLDLLLEKGLISPTHHWCGMHLRWLYTLRYGLPCVSAVDTSCIINCTTREADNEWRQARETEFNEIMTRLNALRLAKTALNYCVFNHPLEMTAGALVTDASSTLASLQVEVPKGLGEALELLKCCWRKKKS